MLSFHLQIYIEYQAPIFGFGEEITMKCKALSDIFFQALKSTVYCSRLIRHMPVCASSFYQDTFVFK